MKRLILLLCLFAAFVLTPAVASARDRDCRKHRHYRSHHSDYYRYGGRHYYSRSHYRPSYYRSYYRPSYYRSYYRPSYYRSAYYSPYRGYYGGGHCSGYRGSGFQIVVGF